MREKGGTVRVKVLRVAEERRLTPFALQLLGPPGALLEGQPSDVLTLDEREVERWVRPARGGPETEL